MSKEKFELIFKNAQELIQEFASVRYQDKYNQLGILKNDIDIQNKSNVINEIVKSNNEIIKNKEEQEGITPIETENKLSLMQKVAHFLQKHNIFMNLSFVDKFVHQQLDVLPVPKQEIKNINTQSTNKTKENFINGLTDFGKYRNLPPIERMSDPEKIEEMKRKMQQNQKINQDYERE